MLIKSVSAWKRLSDEYKGWHRAWVRHYRPIRFRCQCVQCWNCHDTRTVRVRQTMKRQTEKGYLVDVEQQWLFCFGCGMPKTNRGHWFGDKHSSACHIIGKLNGK